MQGMLPWRMILFGVAAGAISFLALAISTSIIPNPIFPREEPVRVLDYAILASVSVLAAGLGASFAVPRACPLQRNKLLSGGILTFLAISCPVCNVAVVTLIGTGGALAWFAPVHSLLGLAAIATLTVALIMQIREIRGPGSEAITGSSNPEPATKLSRH